MLQVKENILIRRAIGQRSNSLVNFRGAHISQDNLFFTSVSITTNNSGLIFLINKKLFEVSETFWLSIFREYEVKELTWIPEHSRTKIGNSGLAVFKVM